MSKPRRDPEYLTDIVEAMKRVAAYVSGLTFELFLQDTRTQDAVVRNLEVIGEAAKSLSPALKKSVPHIPWRSMAGMRDKVIHHYFGINYDTVWAVASQQILDLLPQVEQVLAQARGDEPAPE